ncbi:MAG: diphosphomevalonate decarboxylase [Aeriscardovia sp.]|nr:diphosphomevalonate decarboxylase [Aeriscardovia sp.]
MSHTAVAKAHANIALVKYWGKKNDDLRIPWCSNISMTLQDYWTETRFIPQPQKSSRTFFLNGEEIHDDAASRVIRYIDRLQQHYHLTGGYTIISNNHVPLSAGFASSASGFAALAGSFAAAYELDVTQRELTRLARLGSGSASRSIYGGFVKWVAGTDHQSSFAYPLDEYPSCNITVISVTLNTRGKKISSTEAMRRSVASPYFPTWVTECNQCCTFMETAIHNNDFTTIGQLAQQNAIEMHAMTLCTQPGFTYFTPQTLAITNFIQQLCDNGLECYWTCDAGPNPKILVQASHQQEVITQLTAAFPHLTYETTTFGPGIEIRHE